MKMQSNSLLFGVLPSEGDFEGTPYSHTTFYLPAELASSKREGLGFVTVGYRFGDASEYKKWVHLKNSWPVGGFPVSCDFDTGTVKDKHGKDISILVLVGIKPVGKTV